MRGRVGTPRAKERKRAGPTPLRKRAVEIAAGESGSHVRLELSSTGQDRRREACRHHLSKSANVSGGLVLTAIVRCHLAGQSVNSK